MTYDTPFGTTIEVDADPFSDGDATCAGCGDHSIDALCDDRYGGRWTIVDLASAPDIWWDDEGCWRQLDGQTYGPFQTEREAEGFDAAPTIPLAA